jgi:hypothetical protein
VLNFYERRCTMLTKEALRPDEARADVDAFKGAIGTIERTLREQVIGRTVEVHLRNISPLVLKKVLKELEEGGWCATATEEDRSRDFLLTID